MLTVAAPSPVHVDEIAGATGLRWAPLSMAGYRPQRITLDCTRLAALVDLPADAASAARLVAEYRTCAQMLLPKRLFDRAVATSLPVLIWP